jgi:hypothetical protein
VRPGPVSPGGSTGSPPFVGVATSGPSIEGATGSPQAESPSASAPVATAKTTATPRATPRPTSAPVACRPTDQDAYVYHPYRLEVLAACVYVTGTVAAVRREADGDLHILVALPARYASLLRPANSGEELGDLVVEPVCVKSVTQTDAIAICATDPDPLAPPYPALGESVWLEGRYVLDLDHGGWAELHPLFRWGLR